MSSFPPPGDDRSQAQNPFQAPQSSYEEAVALPGQPRVVVFADLWNALFAVVWSQPYQFLVGTVALGTMFAAFTAAFHIVAGEALLPPYDFQRIMMWQGIFNLLQAPASALLFVGMTRIWLEACAGREVGPETLVTSFRWWPVALGLGIVVDVAWLVGAALCCVPGVFIGVVAAAGLSVAVAEGRGVFDSLQRAYDLTMPSFWGVLGAMAAVIALGGAMVVPPMFLGVVASQLVVGVVSGIPAGAAVQLIIVLKVVIYRLTSGAGVTIVPSGDSMAAPPPAS